MSDRDATPQNAPAELGDLRAEWARRGARLLPGNVIVTDAGQNGGDFRRRVYGQLGLKLAPLPEGWRW